MKQLTLNDIQRTELTVQDRRVLSFLKEGNTQSQISRILKVPKSTVCTTVRKLEKAKLIRKKFVTNYNIIYDVAELPDAEPAPKEPPVKEPTPVRVHNIAMKFKIERLNNALSTEPKTGYEKKWSPRNKRDIRYLYWFPGDGDEPGFHVTIHPKTLVVRMDAGQKVNAPTSQEAVIKGYQLATDAARKFCDKQKIFGTIIVISSTGKPITKPHAGLAFRKGGPLDYETHIEGTWVDESKVSELAPDKKGIEMHTDHPLLTPLERGVLAVAGIPDLLKSTIAPLSQSIDSMTAHIQAGQTPAYQISQQNNMILALMAENRELRKRIEQLEGMK